MQARWSCTPYSVAEADRLVAELGVSRMVASILARRGYGEPEAARAFLDAGERHDPFAFPEMAAVCERILGHVERGSRIVVHGDYDVDGVCSTAILVRTLRALGADVGWHLPSRFDGGYGLSSATVQRLAAEGTGLIVTVDCAISAADEVDVALALGMDVIVTDHHRPGERLPACPVLHPALGGYPFGDLCATAVAHKLAEALFVTAGRDSAEAAGDLELVGLATICDVVPLRGENRHLAREGMRALARTRRPGLRALMKIAQVDPGSVSEHTAGFRLGPRINAAGRLQRADAALELLLTEDEERAAAVADELDLLNRERQDTETRILFAAEAARAEQADAAAYVLAGEGWHPGVIGIVASRLVERHQRPCVLVALDGATGTGSGRSIPAFDLHAAFGACARHLRRFGGHRAAAGLEIDTSEVAAFREAFAAHAASSLSPEDLVRVTPVDAVVPGDALGLGLADELASLGPFGQGNPSPVLMVPAARVSDVRGMGDDGQHARFTVSSGGARARAAAFRTPPRTLEALGEEPHDLAIELEANEWNGAVEPRVVLRAACPTEPGECTLLVPPAEGRAFFDELAAELEQGDATAAARHARTAPATPAGPRRPLIDRRGEGVAGVAGDLLSSGARVLVVCADAARRRRSLGRLVGGLAARVDCIAGEEAPLAAASWHELARDPALASQFEHVLALDPPATPGGEALLSGLPAADGAAFVHLAWGLPEVEFARAVARAELDLRPGLAALYRALRDERPAEPAALERVLRGAGEYPRAPRSCARLLRVLVQLGFVAYDARAHECTVRDAPRTSLERSAAFRAAQEELVFAEAALGRAAGALRERRAA